MLLATGCRHAPTLTLQRDHSWLWRWWWRWWLWWWWWSGGGYKHHNHNGIWISFISFPWVASWLISIWGVTITSSPSQKRGSTYQRRPKVAIIICTPTFYWSKVFLSRLCFLAKRARIRFGWNHSCQSIFFFTVGSQSGQTPPPQNGLFDVDFRVRFSKDNQPLLFIKTTEHPSTFKNTM